MSKTKKFILRAIPVFMLVVVVITCCGTGVLATNGVPYDMPTGGNGISTVDNLVSNIWGTVLTVAQVLAFAAIIFAGVRYMFASADQKADIKKQLVILAVGAVLVFGASTVVKILVSAVQDTGY